MTVQDGAQEGQARGVLSFQVSSKYLRCILFKIYHFDVVFFKWKGIIKHQSSARSFHLLLMTLYLTTCCLNLYPPPQGLITKPTDSAEPNYSLLVSTVSLTSTTCSIKHTAHVQIFLCLYATLLDMTRQFLGRFLTSLAFGFPVESLLSCFLVSSRVYIRAKVAL